MANTGKIIQADGVEGLLSTKNFIQNGFATINNAGWAPYADAAGTQPVDGTGGAPTVTFTQSTTAPLIGNASFIFTAGANVQGQGVSYDFTIDSSYKAKVMSIEFEYLVNSGTFVAGSSSANSDITVYIYDVTNSVLIQPSSYKLLSNSTTITDKFKANFQTASNSTSYRLIFHVTNATNAAFTLKMDDIKVCPTNYVFGTPITDWQSYTPSWLGAVSNPAIGNGSLVGKWRRVGDSMEVFIEMYSGTTTTWGSGNYQFGLPSGFAFDSSKVSLNGNRSNLGSASIYSTTTVHSGTVVAYNGLNLVAIMSATSGIVTNLIPQTLANITTISMMFHVPILGWSSSVQMSDSADTRIVDFVGYCSTSTALTANVTQIPLTAVKDSHGAWSSNQYTIPVAGDYTINVSSQYTVAVSTVLFAYVNGVMTSAINGATLSQNAYGSTILPNLKTGDVISFRVNNAATTNINTTFYYTISRISGPSAIAANELVAASYWLSANFAASTTVPINFDSKEFDTHGAVTTSATAWKFTAPISGTYEFGGCLMTASGASFAYQVYKNGSVYKYITTSNATTPFRGPYNNLIKLNAGDYIDIRPSGAATIQGGALSAADVASFTISRVGF